ncbi:MAG: hydroxylamine oxidation protein HaoB, partial [Lautropia sp.]
RVLRQAAVIQPEELTPLAELAVAESPAGPVLLHWQAPLDAPVLTLMPPASEVAALAPVLERHVAAGTSVLAWWDVSRQLALLSSPPVAFGRHLGKPLFVPARWQARRPDIEAIERDFWGIADTPEFRAEQDRFQRFVDALVADEREGMAGLRALAEGKPTVLVLHVRDAILLGQMAPRRIGVAFRDFGGVTDVHSMVRRVHAWLDQNRYPAYATLQLPDQRVRAVAFTDTPSTETLAARLLPVIGNDQRDVAGATLVYRVGGFVVYQIAAGATP